MLRIISRILGFIRYSIRLNSVRRAKKRLKKSQRKLSSMRVYKADHRAVKRKIRFVKIVTARNVLKLLRVFSVEHKRILVSSFQFGKFACNPKYIVEGIKEKYPDEYEIIWAFWNPRKFAWLKDWGYKTIRVNSIRYFYLAITSGVFIYNMRIPAVVPFRPDQLVINTGHGGGAYKKLLLDNPTINITDAKEITLADQNTSVYLSSCQAYSDVVIRGAFGSTKAIWNTGMPRNDILINSSSHQDMVQTICERIKRQYSIPKENRIILYAPTYRKGERIARDFFIDWNRVVAAIRDRFGGEWTIVYRIHYFINDKVTGQKALPYQIVDASDYYDMQELLLASDVLITDYSSTVWDYAYLHRPGFLYTPDINEYIENQGFYTNIEDWPFTYSMSNDQLVEAIRNYDEVEAARKIDDHHRRLGSFETGQSTSDVIDNIIEWLGKYHD